MITLTHISDAHLTPLPAVKPLELFNKRITGYLNWKLKRRRTLDGEGLVSLATHLREQNPDFTAVTGDLVNLALDAEIVRARGWLESIGPADKVCVSPGNHDAYVPGALKRSTEVWNEYMSGETLDPSPFPYVRRIGEIAVICCSSAVPTGPWMASGIFDEEQAGRLARCLYLLGDAGYFRVVMIHHPPNLEARNPRVGLWGGKRFRKIIAEHGAEMVLHGHTHRSTIHSIHGPGSEVPVIGVAAAGAAQGSHGGDDPARYNLFRIERTGNAWSCTMREFGFQRLGNEIVMRLQMRIY
ncbi:MAG: putative phosphohydrolase, Icc family [Hyphomicrobiales bacterium]|nr:putative phosphohydrolase, Icc family [Hyphomicrobiales bacterium]